jgi:hypothetical protein
MIGSRLMPGERAHRPVRGDELANHLVGELRRQVRSRRQVASRAGHPVSVQRRPGLVAEESQGLPGQGSRGRGDWLLHDGQGLLHDGRAGPGEAGWSGW